MRGGDFFDATPIGLPIRLGIALPIDFQAPAYAVNYGLFVRLVVLTSRAAQFGRENRK